MILSISIATLGVFFAIDAIVQMFHHGIKDGWKWQLRRVGRLFGGIYLLFVPLMGGLPTINLVTVDVNLGGLFQTALSSGISGTAVFLSVRYVGKIVERADNRKKNGNTEEKKDA